MANVPSCTQTDNYGPRSIHQSGLNYAYTFTRNGVIYRNGQTYIGESGSPQPATPALAIATPNCRECHGGC
jgi:hypothetical protein